jgi:hypothetical protein
MKLQRWFAQVNYEGIDYSDYYIAAQRFFRCTGMERATFTYIREQMHGAVDPSENFQDVVLDVTFQDDCLIARYMVLVHKDFERGVRMAQMFLDRLERKGYVDPETADELCVEEDDDAVGVPRAPAVPLNAPEPTGRYIAINISNGSSGGSQTTFSVQRQSHAVEREALARKRVAAEIAQIAGPTTLVARRIDGVARRWSGLHYHGNDDRQTDPIEV